MRRGAFRRNLDGIRVDWGPMMRRAGWPFLLLVSGAVLVWPSRAAAQAADASLDPLAPVRSMGKPPVWKPFAGGYYGLDRSGDEHHNGGGGYFGIYKDLMPSIVGIGMSAEGYLGGYSGVSGVNGGGARCSSCAGST